MGLIDLLFLLVLFSCCLFSDHSGGIVSSFISEGVELIVAREVHGAEDAQEAEGDGRPPLRHLVLHQPKAAANAVRRWLQALRGYSVPQVRGQHNVHHHLRQDLGHPIRQGKKKRPGRFAVVTRGMPARGVSLPVLNLLPMNVFVFII